MRLVRDGATFDVWLVKVDDGEELWCRDDGGEPRQLPTRWKFSAGGELEELVIARLGDGWHRVRDPEREDEVDTEPMEPALEAALRANLDDEAAALVYADWYQQRQHPRGELIAVQVTKSKQPLDMALAEAEDELLSHVQLLGPLDTPHARLGLELEWRNGFIHTARLVGKDTRKNSAQRLWELLRHPSARFLNELVIGCASHGDQDNQAITAIILRAGPTPPLRKLVLADFDDSELDNIDISRAWLGDLEGLSEKYPLLEECVIKGRLIGARDNNKAHGGLRGLSLPHARRFAVRTSGLMAETLASIVTAPWPELVDLEIWTGTDEYGCTATLQDFEPLWTGSFPKLRTLRLMNSEFTDELVPRVIDFVRRHPLEVLDFSLGTLTDAGANALIAGREALAGLRTLYVYENCLSETGLDCLHEAELPVVETPPFPGKSWRQRTYNRTGTQKTARYVTVSE